MKRLLLFVLMLAAAESHAQNWNPLPPAGAKRYFVNEAGYLRGMRVDSIRLVGSDSVFYPFRSMRGTVSQGFLTSSNQNGPSWLGSAIRKRNDGSWLFNTWKGDTVVIKPLAMPGSSWRFFDDSAARWYLATVTSADTLSLMGTVDSVKTITLTAMSGSLPLTSDSLNGWTIMLSKRNGFVTIPDLYMIPYPQNGTAMSQDDYWFGRIMGGDSVFRFEPLGQFGTSNQDLVFGSYASVRRARFSLVTYQPPTRALLFHNWHAGDAAYFKHSYQVTSSSTGVGKCVDTAVARLSGPSSDTLAIRQWKWNDLWSISNLTFSTAKVAIDSAPLLSPTRMPEESPGAYILQYLPTDSSYGLLSPMWRMHADPSVAGIPIYSGYYSGGNVFKAGVGHVFFYRGCGQAPCNGHEMIAYKIGGVTYGTPFNAPNSVRDISVNASTVFASPNPTSSNLHIQHPGVQVTFSFTDVTGRTIHTVQANSSANTTDIDVSTWPAGLYAMTANAADGFRFTQKIIIAR